MHMHIRRLLAGAAVATTALVSFVGPVSAANGNHSTSAKVVGTVKIDRNNPGVAYVLAQYRCTVADPANDPAHLWVSVKQNEAGTVDSSVSDEGAGWGGTVARWEDSHRNEVNCDGKSHTQRFTVDQVEDKSSYGTLTTGQAWVQFCLFDDTTPKGDGVTDFGEPVSSLVWARVN
jgi:hypothetical protein